MAYAREVRLGLVLYGGVSLAVYENGVAQELYRAMRGQGVYGLLSKLIDADIVVDIVSGTSAGGVNGIMLAYALANRRAFAPSAELWRNQGDIERLMRTLQDPNASSVLNSDYYQEKLQACFADGLTPDATAPAIEEFDLFVTGTDANGALSTVYDELGHAVDIKNHRALFQLSYRDGRKNDLSAPPADLAKLARLTSCFPAAFEPVRIETTDKNFFRWGQLRGPAVYLDGGVLNNKPFTSTINAIATRLATRAVERLLIYVEPNPEQFAPAAAPAAPAMAQAALKALVSIPGYQSIAGDLAAIEAHNERAAKVAEVLDALPEAPPSTAAALAQAGVVSGAAAPYLAARLIQLRDTAVECILDDAGGRGYFPSRKDGDSTPDTRRSGRILVASFNQWQGAAEETLVRYDVFFRMRRVAHLDRTLMRAARAGEAPPAALWATVNHYFNLYEMAQWAMMRWLRIHDFAWQRLSADYPELETLPAAEQKPLLAQISMRFWGQVQQRLEELLHAPIPVPAEITPEARAAFYNCLLDPLKNTPAGEARATPLLEAIDAALKQALAQLAASTDAATRAIAQTLQDEFCRFLEIDRQVFLVQFGAEFESAEPIRVVRFSPLDAQRGLSRGPVAAKVRGIALNAFGGFFKKSWRANDIMVGRLDAACLLLESLLSRERLAALAQTRAAAPLSVTAEELQSWFAQMEPAEASALAARINGYLAKAGNATPEEWNQLVDGLVEAAHDEIHHDEYPRVVACALEQEYDWGRYRSAASTAGEPYDRTRLIWRKARARPDEVLVQVAAEAIARGRVPPFSVTPFPPGSQQPDSFFDEIPGPVLEELGALAAIRLGKGLLASVPNQEKRRQLAGSALYRYPFGWVAPILYRFAHMRRISPESVILTNTAIVVIGLMLIALAAALPHLGIRADAMHRWGMGAAGALVLILWGWWFRR